MEKKHFWELSNLLMGIKGETIGKPGDQGSVYPPPPPPPWEGLLSLHNYKGSFLISVFDFLSLFQKLWTKCLINMCCKNAHVSTIIKFTLKLAVTFSLSTST